MHKSRYWKGAIQIIRDTFFWPILDSCAAPPSPLRPSVLRWHFDFSKNCLFPSKKHAKIETYGSKFWKKCHVTLCLIPTLHLVSFGDTVPYPSSSIPPTPESVMYYLNDPNKIFNSEIITLDRVASYVEISFNKCHVTLWLTHLPHVSFSNNVITP